MSQPEHDTTQAQQTMYLKPFECEVPLLHTPDGAFVPVVALCDVLGLPTSPYIALACNRFRPEGAMQRLPFQKSTDAPPGQVWCILEEMVAAWVLSVPTEQVSTDRREQLQAFKRQAMEATSHLYTTLQHQYRVTRGEIFEWLRMCEDLPTRLRRIAERAAPHLHPNCRAELDTLMGRGFALFEESAERARTVVQEITQQPVMDTVVLNAEGEVVDTGSIPLLPILPSQPLLQQSQAPVMTWLHEFNAFLTAHGLP